MMKGSINNYKIIVRGAGDIATGTIHRLFKAGFRPIVLEIDKPSAIRRQVSMCEAVYDKVVVVEGVTARLARDLDEALEVIAAGEIPIIVDQEGRTIEEYKPDAVIDAILAKRNIGTSRSMAGLTIALGPGFAAGVDCDYVIETMRGHNLGRIISEGTALPNTGIPGVIAGVSRERVIHSPAAGVIRSIRQISDEVSKGDIIAYIDPADYSLCNQGGLGHIASGQEAVPVYATISGLIRGLIRDGYELPIGMKMADIDPRIEEYENCFTISDKARNIAGSVLEIVCEDYTKKFFA